MDSNAAAQLKALESLVALLDVADENVAARVAKDIASGEHFCVSKVHSFGVPRVAVPSSSTLGHSNLFRVSSQV